MPINFPDTPAVDQTFASGNRSWRWTGSRWEAVIADPILLTDYYTTQEVDALVSEEVDAVLSLAAPALSDTQPTSPSNGARWFKTTTLQEFLYYNGTWIEV